MKIILTAFALAGFLIGAGAIAFPQEQYAGTEIIEGKDHPIQLGRMVVTATALPPESL